MTSPQNLGLLGPICWRATHSPKGHIEVKLLVLHYQYDQPVLIILIFHKLQNIEEGLNTPDGVEGHVDSMPRHSDSSQTWSSENDSSDVEGSERNEFPPSNLELEEEEQGS